MSKWNMTMRFWQDVEFEVEADSYDDAVNKAYDLAQDFPEESLEDIQCELHDYEELLNSYSDELEEEEFEPGRTYVDIMGLNP